MLTKYWYGEGDCRVTLLTLAAFPGALDHSKISLSQSRVNGDAAIALKASETAHIIYMRGNGSLGSLAPGGTVRWRNAGCITHVRIVEKATASVEWEELAAVLALTPETFQYDKKDPTTLGSERMAVVSCVINWDEMPQDNCHLAGDRPSELGPWAVSNDVALPPKLSDASPIPSLGDGLSAPNGATVHWSSMQPIVPSMDLPSFAERVPPSFQPGDCVMLEKPLPGLESMTGPFEVRRCNRLKCLLYDWTIDRQLDIWTGEVRACNTEEESQLNTLKLAQPSPLSTNNKASEGAGSTVFRKGDYVVTRTLDPKHPQLLRALKIYDWDGSSGPYYMYDPVSGYVHVAPACGLRPCHPSEIPDIAIDEEKRPFKPKDLVHCSALEASPGEEQHCAELLQGDSPYHVVKTSSHDTYIIRQGPRTKRISVKREDLAPASDLARGSVSKATRNTAKRADDEVVTDPPDTALEEQKPRGFECGDWVMLREEVRRPNDPTAPLVVESLGRRTKCVVFDPTTGTPYLFQASWLRRCKDEEGSRDMIGRRPFGLYDLVTFAVPRARRPMHHEGAYRVVGFRRDGRYQLQSETNGNTVMVKAESVMPWKPAAGEANVMPVVDLSQPPAADGIINIPTISQLPEIGDKRKMPAQSMEGPPLRLQKTAEERRARTGAASEDQGP